MVLHLADKTSANTTSPANSMLATSENVACNGCAWKWRPRSVLQCIGVRMAASSWPTQSYTQEMRALRAFFFRNPRRIRDPSLLKNPRPIAVCPLFNLFVRKGHLSFWDSGQSAIKKRGRAHFGNGAREVLMTHTRKVYLSLAGFLRQSGKTVWQSTWLFEAAGSWRPTSGDSFPLLR